MNPEKKEHLPKLKGNNEQNKCGSKKRNLTKKEADNQRSDVLKKDPTAEIGVYLCPYCHYWHIGRKRYKDGEKPILNKVEKPKPKRPMGRKSVVVVNGKQVRG